MNRTFGVKSFGLIGGPGEVRTPDPMVANHVLSQLSYRPMFPIQLYWPGIHNSSSERGLSSTIVVPRHSGDLAPKTIKSIVSQAEMTIEEFVSLMAG